MKSEKLIIINFFQSGTNPHPSTGFCMPTKSNTPEVICINISCLMHIHCRILAHHWMRVSNGRQKDYSNHTRSSKCPTPRAVSDHTGWWGSNVPLNICGGVEPLLAARARAFYRFSVSLLDTGPQDAQGGGGLFTVGLLEPIYVSDSPSGGPEPRGAGMVKGNHISELPWEEIRSRSSAVSLPRSWVASLLVASRCCSHHRLRTLAKLIKWVRYTTFISLLALWVTSYFSRYWNQRKIYFWLCDNFSPPFFFPKSGNEEEFVRHSQLRLG